MIEEIKNKVQSKLEELKAKSRVNDLVVNFLEKDPVGDFHFKSELKMSPYEVVEQYGVKVLQEEKEFQKHFNPKYDVFLQEWEKHYEMYWIDKLHLVESYSAPKENNLSPFDIFNNLSDQMIKIERRSLLLNPEPKPPHNIVKQKQKRLDGSEKEYKFIRAYYIDERGEKKRMISRLLGDRYLQKEKEIANLFHDRGYAVHRGYRSEKGNIYDIMIERDRMKTVVEVKIFHEDTFNNLFLFDELQKRFNQDYGDK